MRVLRSPEVVGNNDNPDVSSNNDKCHCVCTSINLDIKLNGNAEATQTEMVATWLTVNLVVLTLLLLWICQLTSGQGKI